MLFALLCLASAGARAGSGFAHAGDGALLLILGIPLLMIAAPVWLMSKPDPIRRRLGIAILLVDGALLLLVLAYAYVMPRYEAWQFRRGLDGLRIAAVKEEPILMSDGAIGGLSLTLDLQVPQPVLLDLQGKGVLRLLSEGLVVGVNQQPTDRGASSPFTEEPARTSLDGVPLEALPAVIAAREAIGQDISPGPKLPQGLYRIEQRFLLDGLQTDKGKACAPSLPASQMQGWISTRLTEMSDLPMQVWVVATRPRLDWSGGDHHVVLRAPLKFRYQHGLWCSGAPAASREP